MQISSGVTNEILAHDIKRTYLETEDKKNKVHLVMPVRENVAQSNLPASNLVKRRLSDFYNKTEQL